MDEMFITLKTKMVTSILSKLLSKFISKKMRCKINCQTKDVSVQLVDERVEISANIKFDASKKDFINCLSKLI